MLADGGPFFGGCRVIRGRFDFCVFVLARQHGFLQPRRKKKSSQLFCEKDLNVTWYILVTNSSVYVIIIQFHQLIFKYNRKFHCCFRGWSSTRACRTTAIFCNQILPRKKIHACSFSFCDRHGTNFHKNFRRILSGFKRRVIYVVTTFYQLKSGKNSNVYQLMNKTHLPLLNKNQLIMWH